VSGRTCIRILVVLAVLLASTEARAAVRRFALVMGNDHGDAGEVELRYAATDAQRVYDVLKDLGGFEPADMVVLRDESGARAQSTLISLNDRIRSAIAQGDEAFLFVYYSGHAGADALHMSRTHFELSQLEQLVRGSSATFRVLVVDACRSGALTRVKGGRAVAPFDIRVNEHLSEQGLVFLTSSAANEDAQESDVLKGSFFTHHFVSALLGAADADHDGQVTLEEAYKYTYEATLRSTSQTWAGLQHPTFRYELQGAGKLSMTEIATAAHTRAVLNFPAGRTYLAMEGNERGAVVAEVSQIAVARRISVPAGHYFIRGRTPDALLEGEVDAPAGSTVEVRDDRLHRIAYARLVRKGEASERIAHGPEAGYLFHTSLSNASSLCHGAFAGYVAHFEKVSVGGRLAGCHASFTNDVLRASINELGGELRVLHTWDLPVIGVDLGLGLGGWLLDQKFSTRGDAPSRATPAGSLALVLGVHADLGAGVSLFAEGALTAYVYAQDGADPMSRSLGPFFAYRQGIGVTKVW
jgi:hypothetical protein